MNLIAGSIVEISYKEMYVNKPFKEEYTFEADIYTPLLSLAMHTAGIPSSTEPLQSSSSHTCQNGAMPID